MYVDTNGWRDTAGGHMSCTLGGIPKQQQQLDSGEF